MVKTASPAARRELGRVKAMGQNSMLAMAQSLSTWEAIAMASGLRLKSVTRKSAEKKSALPMMSMLR